MRKNYINRNPANIAKIPKGLSAKKRELPPEDTRERIGKLSGEGFDLYPILIYYTGMRRSEALALEWSDVDLDKRQIHVSKELEFHGNQPVCVPMTKSAKGLRSITIRLPLLDVMREHQGEGLMFPGRSGGYMTKSAFQRAWRRQQLDAVPHQMRHAYTTDLFEAHVPPETAITQTGHSDVKVMQNIYTHIRKRVMDNTTKLLDQYDSKQEDSSQNVVNDPESTEK